jgi:hypothetical protein
MGILGIWVAGGGWIRWRLAGGGVAVVGKVWVGGGWLDFGFKGGEGRRRGFGKKGNGGVRKVGGGLVWWSMAGDGVSVVGEAVGGGGCGINLDLVGEGRRWGCGKGVRPKGK